MCAPWHSCCVAARVSVFRQSSSARSRFGNALFGLMFGMGMVGSAGCLGSEDSVSFPQDSDDDVGVDGVGAGGTGPANDPPVVAVTVETPSTTGGDDAMPVPWPTCEGPQPGALATTLHQIWHDDPAQPEAVWLNGVFVTAISEGGCRPDATCQLFVQSQESFADLDSAAQQSLRVLVTAGVSHMFTAVSVGDQVDLLAHAFRKTTGGSDELVLKVSAAYPGCSKTVGSGDPQPVTASLCDLSVAAYEYELGPVLVELTNIKGTPNDNDETFGLWGDWGCSADPGDDDVTSVSPYFLDHAQFQSTPQGTLTEFASVVGVFGLFVPDYGAKFEELYVRSMDDLVVLSPR